MTARKTYPPAMKAVFLEKPGGPLIVKETAIPDPASGEVIVKIAAAPVNPSDILRIRNAPNNYDLSNFIPGLEGSGRVVAAGKGLLPHLWLGKRVSCSSKYPSSGTWAEYMVTSADNCFPLNRKVSDEQGSMSLVNPLTALAFFEIVRKNGHKAIINNAAASALGRMVELLGRKARVPVINIVRNQRQVDTLKGLGSVYILNSTDPAFIDNLGSLSEKLEATLLFDSVCSRQLQQIIEVLPRRSSVIIYGNLSGEEHIMINPRSLIDKDAHISGFYLGNRAKENGLIKNMMNLLKVGRLMSSDLKINIQGRFPLIRAQEALDTYLKNMSAGKVLLIPGAQSG